MSQIKSCQYVFAYPEGSFPRPGEVLSGKTHCLDALQRTDIFPGLIPDRLKAVTMAQSLYVFLQKLSLIIVIHFYASLP